MNDVISAKTGNRDNDAVYAEAPHRSRITGADISNVGLARLDKLALLLAAIMALGPLAMAAYGAHFGASAMG